MYYVIIFFKIKLFFQYFLETPITILNNPKTMIYNYKNKWKVSYNQVTTNFVLIEQTWHAFESSVP